MNQQDKFAPACNLPGNYPMSHGDVAADHIADICKMVSPAADAERAAFESACQKFDIPTNSTIARRLFQAGRASVQQAVQTAPSVTVDTPAECEREMMSDGGRHRVYAHEFVADSAKAIRALKTKPEVA